MKQRELEKFLEKYKDKYEIVIIGRTVLGQNIYSVNIEFDKTYRWCLITAGIHAREHLSCNLVCEFIKRVYKKKQKYNISFVPLVNPDGVDLCCNDFSQICESEKEKLIKINGSDDFSLFKANANGVDLNNNWDANFEKKYTKRFFPSSQGFYGYKSMSEPEVKSLEKWTKKINPFLCLSYHLKGEEIYFDFFQKGKIYERDKKIAEIFAKSSGYKIKSTQEVSSGGYKDWCVQKLKIPALTIELGDDKFSHPYPKSELKNIYKKNAKLFKNIEKSLKIYQHFNNL